MWFRRGPELSWIVLWQLLLAVSTSKTQIVNLALTLYLGMAGVEVLQHTVPRGASQVSAPALYRLEEARATSRRMAHVVAQKGTRAREAPSEIAALS